MILACLKTSIGLVTSCAETFTAMFPNGPKYGFWAICFSIFSLLVTNIGLNAIIAISLPVLMFLFPLAITLILLALLGICTATIPWCIGGSRASRWRPPSSIS